MSRPSPSCLLLLGTVSILLLVLLPSIRAFDSTIAPFPGLFTNVNNGLNNPQYPPAAPAVPGRRQHVAFASDGVRSLYLFGGGYGGGTHQYRNDLWEWDTESNIWVWHNTEVGDGLTQQKLNQHGILNATESFPGSREHTTLRHMKANLPLIRLFGGQGFSTNTSRLVRGRLGDLWTLNTTGDVLTWRFHPPDPRLDTVEQSMWMDIGEDVLTLPYPYPASRYSPAMFIDPFSNDMYIVSGVGVSGSMIPLDCVWRFGYLNETWECIPDAGNAAVDPLIPLGGLVRSATFEVPDYINYRATYYVFGKAFGSSYDNSIWSYDPLTANWTTITPRMPPVGSHTSGDPDAEFPFPGARTNAAGIYLPPGLLQDSRFDTTGQQPSKTDRGSFLICGGRGTPINDSRSGCYLGDCWSFSLTLSKWTWWQLTSSNLTKYVVGPGDACRFEGGGGASWTGRSQLGFGRVGRQIVIYGGRHQTWQEKDVWSLSMPCENEGHCPFVCADGIANDQASVCNSNGNCSTWGGPCICDYPILTEAGRTDCASWDCDDGVSVLSPGVCSGHGICSFENRSCVCNETDWEGEICGDFRCADGKINGTVAACNGHGFCNEPGGECVCFDDGMYWASTLSHPHCGIHRCADRNLPADDLVSLCNGHGTCNVPLGSCACTRHWVPSNNGTLNAYCDIFTCRGSVECLNGGRCVTPGGPCVCAVEAGSSISWWWGPDCGRPLSEILIPASVGGGVAVVVGCIALVGIFLIIAIVCCGCANRNGESSEGGGGGGRRRARQKSMLSRRTNEDELVALEEDEGDESAARLDINRKLFELDYRVLRVGKRIGEGGSSAVVYKAEMHGETVAFKCFKLYDFRDQSRFKEFEQEVSVIASVSHPHILRFFGATICPPRVGIVMEYCTNGDLREYLKKTESQTDPEDALSLHQRLTFLREIASAMNHLHSLHIVHRDLKTENVLLDKHLSCRVMDFGLSRLMVDMDAEQTVQIGTMAYMAPEMALGEKYDSKVDVFAYGIMMYEILTHKTDIYGSRCVSTTTVAIRVANDELFRPVISDETERERQIPEEVRETMALCWDRDPGKRPAFFELLDLCVKWLEEEEEEGKKKKGGKGKVDEEEGGEKEGDKEEEEEEGEEKKSSSSDSSDDSTSSSSDSSDSSDSSGDDDE